MSDEFINAVMSLANLENKLKQGVQVGDEGKGGASTSYANSLKKKIPAVHALAVARAELQKRKIRLIKVMGLKGDGLGDLLTEKQWVEKANMALSMMDRQDEGEDGVKPEIVNFVGVSKERENMGVIFELNSSKAAGWLKDKRVMVAFLAKMCSTSVWKSGHETGKKPTTGPDLN